MINNDCRSRFAQVAVVALLACAAPAYADNCAGGADATGNACNGEQATAAVLSKEDSQLIYLKGAAAMATLRFEQALQRQRAESVAVKEAEKELQASQKALNENTKLANR
jgi:hypothetical protein